MLATCPFVWRKPNHQIGYTRENAAPYAAYGPSTKGQHKTQFPPMGWGGVEKCLENEYKNLVSAPLDPTQLLFACSIEDEDNVMVAMSKVLSRPALHKLAGFALQTRRVEIKDLHGIADTGATSVFIKEGVPVDYKQPATNPLTVNLPNGCRLKSTHTCNVVVPGLPHPLLGHIVLNLAIPSLFGIHPLCNAGCIVVFDKDKCIVWYDGKIILTSSQNLSTYL